jgi:hypothetical protein
LLRLLHIALSSSNPRRSWLTSQSNKALAMVPSKSNDLPSPEAETVLNTMGRDSERLATTLDSLQASLVAKPVAQHHRGATQLQSHLVQHIARARRHKRFQRGRQTGSETVGSIRPASRRRKPTVPPSALPPRSKRERFTATARFEETRQRTRRSCALLLEGTRQRTKRF